MGEEEEGRRRKKGGGRREEEEGRRKKGGGRRCPVRWMPCSIIILLVETKVRESNLHYDNILF